MEEYPRECTVLDLKTESRAYVGHPAVWRFANIQDLTPVINSHDRIGMEEIEIHERQVKRFVRNNKDFYIVWSKHLEDVLGVPLECIDNLQSEVGNLNTKLESAQIKYYDLENKMFAAEERHAIHKIGIYLGLFITITLSLVAFNV